jgi:hypothetical protein
MKNELIIVHFNPLEIFPPAMNLLEYISKTNFPFNKITVITTDSVKNLKKFDAQGLYIIRMKGINPESSVFIKLIRYFNFYFFSFLIFLKIKPSNILYFETLSGLPSLFFKRIFPKTNIFVHYHEFVTLDELKEGRFLNKFINKVERKMYSQFKWISHTNKERIDLFIKQYNLESIRSNFYIMPNFPSKNWVVNKEIFYSDTELTTKLVHIGALSFEGMFLNEVLDFFGDNKKYSIDFYSHSINFDIVKKIEKYLNCTFHGSINYLDIPSIYGKYDVGLVLYNGSSLNFTFNAPNKIFEYLALDLDVWCSDKLITAKDFERLHCFPKMILVDYENLKTFNFDQVLDKTDLVYVKSPYFCEPVYEKLINAINENTHS